MFLILHPKNEVLVILGGLIGMSVVKAYISFYCLVYANLVFEVADFVAMFR